MQGIGEMLSKEQMKNVVGGYGCPHTLGSGCAAFVPQYGGTLSGICADSPSGPCKCRITYPSSYIYLTPSYGCTS